MATNDGAGNRIQNGSDSRAGQLLEAAFQAKLAGDRAKAIQLFNDVLAAGNASVEAHSELGNLLSEDGAFDSGVGHLKRALQLIDDAHDAPIDDLRESSQYKAEIHSRIGVAYYNRAHGANSMDDWESALGAFQAAVALDGRHKRALWGLAVSLRKIGRREDAIPTLELFVSLYPEFQGGWSELERTQFAIGRLRDGLRTFMRNTHYDTHVEWRD